MLRPLFKLLFRSRAELHECARTWPGNYVNWWGRSWTKAVPCCIRQPPGAKRLREMAMSEPKWAHTHKHTHARVLSYWPCHIKSLLWFWLFITNSFSFFFFFLVHLQIVSVDRVYVEQWLSVQTTQNMAHKLHFVASVFSFWGLEKCPQCIGKWK